MTPSEPREDAVARDNAISNSGDPHMRLLIAMKYGPTVHGEACKDPAFKARHDAAIDAAIAALSQQGAEPVAWIPLGERMPEEDVEVLVYRQYDRRWIGVRSAPWEVDTSSWSAHYGWSFGSAPNVKVSHWMPFPAAPAAGAPRP